MEKIRKVPHSFFLFLLVMLAIYVAFFLFFRQETASHQQLYPIVGSDATEYATLGTNLFTHGVFSMSTTTPYQVETFRTPGYPLFIGFIHTVTKSWDPVVMVQIFLALFSALLIVLIGTALGSEKAGLVAGVLYLLDPTTLTASLLILSDILYVFLLLSALYLTIIHPSKKSALFLAGITFGLSVLVRPVGLYLFPLVPCFYILFFYRSQAKHILLRGSLLFLLGGTIVCSPWFIRNKLETGIWGFSSVSAYNLLNFNTASYLADQRGTSIETMKNQLAVEAGNLSDPAERDLAHSAQLTSVAKKYLLADPVGYARFHIIKTAPFFLSSSAKVLYLYSQTFSHDPSYQSTLGDNLTSLALHGQWQAFSQALEKNFLFTLEEIGWALLLFLSLSSLWWPKTRRAGLFCLLVVFYFAAVTGPVSYPRYRLPASPFLFLAAALAGEELYRRLEHHLRKLFVTATDHTGIQLLRYTFVGGISFVVDFGLLYVFTSQFHLYYLLSATLSFIIGSVVNYFLSVAWIFQNARRSERTAEFISFVGIGLSGLLLNILIIWIATAGLGFYYLGSKIISAILVYLWNFFIRKIILFSTPRVTTTP